MWCWSNRSNQTEQEYRQSRIYDVKTDNDKFHRPRERSELQIKLGVKIIMSTYIREQRSGWKSEKLNSMSLDVDADAQAEVHSDLLDLLQTARENLDRYRFSAYRCPSHNDKAVPD